MASDETTDGVGGVDGRRGAGQWTTPSSSSSLRQHRRDDDDDDYDYDYDFFQNDEMTNLLTTRTPAEDTDNRNGASNAALESENNRASAKNHGDLREPSSTPTAAPPPSWTWIHDEIAESAETLPDPEFAVNKNKDSDKTTMEQRGDRKSRNQQTRSSPEPTIQVTATVVRRSWDRPDDDEDDDDGDGYNHYKTLKSAIGGAVQFNDSIKIPGVSTQKGANERNENQDDQDQNEDELPHENHLTDTAVDTGDETTPIPLVDSTGASNSMSRPAALPSDQDSLATVPLLLPAQAMDTDTQVELIKVGYCPYHNIQMRQEKQGLWGLSWTNNESNFASGGNCKFCIWHQEEQMKQGLIPSLAAVTTKTRLAESDVEQAMEPSTSIEQLSSIIKHQEGIPLSPTAAQLQPRVRKRAVLEKVLLLIILLLLTALIVTVAKQGGTEEKASSLLNDGLVCPIPSENVFQQKGILLQDGLTLTGSTVGAPTLTEDSPALVCAPSFSMQSQVLYHRLHGDGNCYGVHTDGSNFEVVLGLLVGNLCDATDCQIFYNGFESLGGSSSSSWILETDQGQDYWFVVGGLGARGGNYVVQFESGSCGPSAIISQPPSAMPTVMPSSTPSVLLPTTSHPTISQPPSVIPTVIPSSTPSVLPTTAPTATWRQLGANVDGEAAGDRSGWSVALSSDGYTVAIGARHSGNERGHVRVLQYELSTAQWNQLGSDIDGEASGDQFGQSVALSANGLILAVGARSNSGNGSDSGQVRVFVFSTSTARWNQRGQDLDGEAAGNQFGYSVDLSADGSVVAIGGWLSDGNGNSAGHVRVFAFSSVSSSWIQRGQKLVGEAFDDYFGVSVALSADGMIVVAGASQNCGNGFDSGHVRVLAYQSTSARWAQLGQDIDGEAAGDRSGRAVALSSNGRTVAVGARSNNGVNGSESGHVRVWTLPPGSSAWTQMGQDLDGEAAGDWFGLNLALSANGETLAVGARNNDGNGSDSGHVRIFDFNPTLSQWQQVGADLDGEARGDNFGGHWGQVGVALSADGRVMAAGAPYNDGNGNDAGHVRVFERV